ncbi:MAG TPA: rod shape-determining protein [Candidatus Fimenecus excrementigallinarum]|uniref:Cell shape-determining protein MreB n=1 Tax=Candidatus Fimenecus excrementigallinarum TaxID=2840816 RepID=A0A9D1IHI0_9FIRM|nr:rod shape-determining protein [Candidatus Fimenecus excrementigallinarum]
MPGMHVGIDFGSTSTIMYVDGKGIVLDEPTMIAVDTETGVPIAIGNAAYTINGRTDERIDVISPVQNGIISNYTMAQHILRYYFQRLCGNSILKPTVILTVPSGATNLERRTFLEVAMRAGAGRVCLVEEALASAIGVGFESRALSGRFIVNMGGGAVDVSVVTMGSLAVAKTIKGAGKSIDDAIARYLRRERDILIGPQTAEHLKICLGSAIPRREELAVMANGKSGLDHMPITFEVTSSELFGCIHERLDAMVRGIKSVLEITPPELVGDISENGIVLTGGTALLFGMKAFLESELGIEVVLADDPIYSCVSGAAAIVRDMDFLTENGYTFRTVQELSA